MEEKAEDTVVREVFEETGIHYEIDRLAVIHENFWDADDGSDMFFGRRFRIRYFIEEHVVVLI